MIVYSQLNEREVTVFEHQIQSTIFTRFFSICIPKGTAAAGAGEVSKADK